MVHTPLRHQPYFWDALIALFSAIALLLIVIAATHTAMEPASGIGLALGGIGLAVLLYGSFIEPKRIKLNTKTIQLPAPAIRAAVIGDIHVGPYKREKYVRHIVEKTNALNPDIILLVGDFLFDHRSDPKHFSPLQHLRARHGVFAIIGNHDCGQHIRHGEHYMTEDRSDDVTAALREYGITVLRNAATRLMLNEQPLHIAGIDDLWMPSVDLAAALKDIPEEEPVFLLAHNPDVILDTRSHRASLILSGHTHGGQIRLPFIGALHPIPDRLGRSYDQGLFRVTDQTTLAITHGIGETQARARLFCTPEILVLTIESA